MRYIVFSYNMLTLSRAIFYTEYVWGKENTDIFYSDVFTGLPLNIKNDYAINVISQEGLDKERGLRAIIDSCLWTKKICKRIGKNISDKDNITLVLFRDNELQEASLINYIKRKSKCPVKVCLMEEGAGLYARSRISTRFKRIKCVVYKMFQLSTYSLLDRPQGLNENVDIIICNKPDQVLDKRRNSRNIQIVNMEDAFTEEIAEYVAESILGRPIKKEKYDYVFLTQPFSMFRDDEVYLKKTYENLLPEILEIVSRKGKVLIKLHPRDDYDYSCFVNERISISSEDEKKVPFECLMTNYGYPQMISLFSSVSFNMLVKRPSIFLYKLFNIPASDKLFKDDDLVSNNIVVCKSIEEFEKLVN